MTGITGGLYPDRAAKQQAPVTPVIRCIIPNFGMEDSQAMSFRSLPGGWSASGT